MPQKSNFSEFVKKAISVHGDRYGYANCEYVNSKTPITILCKSHGYFTQTPNMHLSGRGCPKCKSENAKKLILNKGINDVINGSNTTIYQLWINILKRCYDPIVIKKRPTYKNCEMCDSWLYYSNFKDWVENPDNGYCEGYHIDKDIIHKGNKIYSPENCCFVPAEINQLFTNRKRFRGNFPIGISAKENGFEVRVNCNLKQPKYIGFYHNINDAFMAYKLAKENQIKFIADKYYGENKITKRVYEAMYNYKIEITD